jgi:hypothetical protein
VVSASRASASRRRSCGRAEVDIQLRWLRQVRGSRGWLVASREEPKSPGLPQPGGVDRGLNSPPSSRSPARRPDSARAAADRGQRCSMLTLNSSTRAEAVSASRASVSRRQSPPTPASQQLAARPPARLTPSRRGPRSAMQHAHPQLVTGGGVASASAASASRRRSWGRAEVDFQLRWLRQVRGSRGWSFVSEAEMESPGLPQPGGVDRGLNSPPSSRSPARRPDSPRAAADRDQCCSMPMPILNS